MNLGAKWLSEKKKLISPSVETRFFKAVTRSLILYQEKKQQGDNLVTVYLTVYWSCEICIIDQPQGQCGWILTIFFFGTVIAEMLLLLNKFSLSVPKEMYREELKEYGY